MKPVSCIGDTTGNGNTRWHIDAVTLAVLEKVFTLDQCLHAARLLQFSSIVPVARQFFAERAHSVRFIFAECAAQAKTFRTEWDARVNLFSPEWAARAEAFTTGCDSAQLPVGQIWARRAFRLEVCYRTNAKV